MKHIFSPFLFFLNSLLLSSKSNYSFKDKFEVFRILISNYIRHKIVSNNRKEINQKIFDFKVTAYNYNTLQFLFKEIFLSNDYSFNSTNPSPRIIDCGANIGMSILYFKKLYPDCSIIAFEPNPTAFALLEKNILQNNLTNIELHNIGLSDKNEELDFFTGENRGSLVGSILNSRGGNNKIIIETKKLSSFIGSNKFDLIKMDVEGAEIQIINDLIESNKIESSSKYIIEYHHKINGINSNFSQFIKQFETIKYEYNIKTDFHEIDSFQDILIYTYSK